MTAARFLSEADSMEITKWFAYFKVKDDYQQHARESAEFQRRIERGQQT